MLHDVTACAKIFQAFSFHISTLEVINNHSYALLHHAKPTWTLGRREVQIRKEKEISSQGCFQLNLSV